MEGDGDRHGGGYCSRSTFLSRLAGCFVFFACGFIFEFNYDFEFEFEFAYATTTTSCCGQTNVSVLVSVRLREIGVVGMRGIVVVTF